MKRDTHHTGVIHNFHLRVTGGEEEFVAGVREGDLVRLNGLGVLRDLCEGLAGDWD